jgi:hypothetical protein
MAETTRLSTDDGMKAVKGCCAKGGSYKFADFLKNTFGQYTVFCKNRTSPNVDQRYARELFLKSAERGGTESFAGHVKRVLQDPIQPFDENGRYRLHPLLMSIIAYGALAVGVFGYFTFFSK